MQNNTEPCVFLYVWIYRLTFVLIYSSSLEVFLQDLVYINLSYFFLISNLINRWSLTWIMLPFSNTHDKFFFLLFVSIDKFIFQRKMFRRLWQSIALLFMSLCSILLANHYIEYFFITILSRVVRITTTNPSWKMKASHFFFFSQAIAARKYIFSNWISCWSTLPNVDHYSIQ